MKKKRLFAIIMIVASLIVLSLIAVYVGIMFTNNSIANRVEKELKNHPLPENTVFLDSISVTGKLVGNGNGMQYMGSILVVSDLTEEELYEYYRQSFDNIEVREQASQVIDFLNSPSYSFELFGDPEHHEHYSITYWGSPTDVGIGQRMAALLNIDLRGH